MHGMLVWDGGVGSVRVGVLCLSLHKHDDVDDVNDGDDEDGEDDVDDTDTFNEEGRRVSGKRLEMQPGNCS